MVKIRLMRVGKRKQPSYRVVVADSRSPRDGRIIESIGNYQPRLEPSGIAIDNERAVYWLQQGAQPSEQVKKLLTLTGAWSEFSGEAPPATLSAPQATPTEAAAAKAAKATPAASTKPKATPAASVEEDGTADEAAEAPEVVESDETAPAGDE